VAQDFLHDHGLVNHGNDAHEVLTDWATKRVGVPDLEKPAGDWRLEAEGESPLAQGAQQAVQDFAGLQG
jgi:hypothetical protein